VKTVNSISGGKTSAYIAANFPADYEVFSLVCLNDSDCAPKDKSLVQYVNAKLEKYIPMYGDFVATAEDDQTLVVMRDLEQFIGKEIIWVRGSSFDNVIDYPLLRGENPSRLPSWARRYCTVEMKLIPIFLWWFNNVGEKVKMRIGFRFDEFDRMEKFLNNGENNKGFSIPVACSTRGKRLQRHESFDWRFCSFPLIKNGITKPMVEEFWKNKYVGGNLFDPIRKIEFPVVSNCVGCFHKKPETLSVMANMHPEKIRWFSKQEDKGMGTWLDSRISYETILQHSTSWSEEMINENSCDSGGCTD
jgi:hypothetical protein